MTNGAEIVIIGAGIIGSSLAFQLARHDVGRITVVDRAPGPAEGSTGASSSICRTRYTHSDVVRVAVDGVDAYRRWVDFLEIEQPQARFVETGAVWIADRSVADVEAEVARLRDAGAVASILTADSLEERFPQVSSCVAPWSELEEHECRRGRGFLFEDAAGYVDPANAVVDVIDAGRRRGVDVRFGAAVTGVERAASRVTGVTLASGERLGADLVVNAAGPWCNHINRLAGVDVSWSLTPTRLQTLHHPWPADDLPVVIDVATGVYARPDRGSDTVWAGSVREEDEREIVDPDNFLTTPNQSFRDNLLIGLQHRLPGLRPTGRVPGIAGLYTINREDVHPVLGPSGVDGFWLAVGFSGHGFKLAPAIGSMMAQAMGGSRLDFDTPVDMALFAADRSPIGTDARNVLA